MGETAVLAVECLGNLVPEEEANRQMGQVECESTNLSLDETA